MKKVQVVTSKESKSGAMLTYVSDVEIVNGKMVLSNTYRIKQDSAYCAYIHSKNDAGAAEVMIWAVARSEAEVAEMVAEKFAELAGTYSVENEVAEVEVEETEEVAAVEVTVAAATFEAVEVKAVEVIATGNITVSKFGVFYKAVKIFSKAIKLAAVSKNFSNSNDFNNICKAIKLAAISKNVSNFKNISSSGGVAKVFNLAAEIEKLKAGGVPIRGSPYFKGVKPFFIALFDYSF